MIQTPGRTNIEADDLYDDTLGYDDETGVRFGPNLTELERKQGTELYRFFLGLWGLCIAKGEPGVGKDAFFNYLQFKLKKIFPWKRIVRDEKPRRAFGPYDGLFDDTVLANDIDKMKKVGNKKDLSDIEVVADKWVEEYGEILLKNSVLYLTEFWNYCYCRDPHKAINKTMGAIHRMYRHLDCLILGTVQQTSDLDKYTCLPLLNGKRRWHVQ